jgi:hypothetical protein
MLSSCTTTVPPAASDGCHREAQELARQNAVDLAESVHRSGSPYFLGVRGFTIDFPGIEDTTIVFQTGYREIEGTSDVVENEGCFRFRSQARAFAERYNRRMRELVLN